MLISDWEQLQTPTPTDPGQVSDESDFFMLSFDCIVNDAISGDVHTFNCDETSSVGWMRAQVSRVFEKSHRPNTYVRTSVHVKLMRGIQILENEHIKLHELREPDDETCRLSAIVTTTVMGEAGGE